MTDLTALAEVLTEAQRRMLLAHFGDTRSAFYAGRSHQTARALVGHGLLVEVSDNVGNPMFKFTDEGLALAPLLKGNGDADA